MYLSLIAMFIIGFGLYYVGYSKGHREGREAMQDLIAANPDLYQQIRTDLDD